MSFLSSNSCMCCTRYSSMGSTMKMTSYPRLRSFSRKGEDWTASTLSPEMKMYFWSSFILETYSSRPTRPSDDEVLKRRSLARRWRLLLSSMTPSLRLIPKFSMKVLYFWMGSTPSSAGLSSSAYSESSSWDPVPSFSFRARCSFLAMITISMALRISFLRITRSSLFSWSVSREMLMGRSSESTTPLMKFRRGSKSSNVSEMKTRRTYSLMLCIIPPMLSKRFRGMWSGMKRSDLKSTSPSALKWMKVKGFSESLEIVWNLLYSSRVMSAGLRIQMGFTSLSKVDSTFLILVASGLDSGFSSSSSSSSSS
eukprot:29243_5